MQIRRLAFLILVLGPVDLWAQGSVIPYHFDSFAVVRVDSSSFSIESMTKGYRAGRAEGANTGYNVKEFVNGFTVGAVGTPLFVWLVDEIVVSRPPRFHSYVKAKSEGPHYLQGFLMGFEEGNKKAKKSAFHFGGVLGLVTTLVVFQITYGGH